ncbi:VWA domain-containing protein [Aeoliella mucimassa]|uniref:von Willebrand factor type A domain protein n=1 Tax=Aeoliella mucimassa TaxID=2527972 RepID=A0A518AVX8_9BACT|nr:VWA domain-containing protein [Aeoliella mucimassa]QDU58897.1 von Willebrand factor type A domain protein [Aeoliella mucimassa]
MNSIWLQFDRPQFLWLFALVPAIWWIGRGGFSGLRGLQWMLANTLRTLVFALVVLALADTQIMRTNNRLTVLYLLDQSHSIPDDQRDAMLDFVNASVEAHRRDETNDRVGVMVFGRKPEIEIPPLTTMPALRRLHALVDPEYSDLAAALAHARGMFPDDSAGRVVLVTDGNENLGNAVAEAQLLTDAGISIDVVPVALQQHVEVSVEKLILPARVRDHETFEMRVVLDVDAPAEQPNTLGTLRLVRQAFGREEIFAEQFVELPPGKTVLSIHDELDRPGFFTYEARFSPADPQSDATARNNRATAFTQIVGAGQVLLIENAEEPGEHEALVAALRRNGLEVEVMDTSMMFSSLIELQRFDCVVLADVPLAGTATGDEVLAFTDDQLRMLIENTESLGCGLVVIGGPNSYGAGGWAGSLLEQALPVDCQVQDAKVVPVGALGLVIDRSGSMDGVKMQSSKAAAIAAVKALGKRDMISVVAFDSTALPVVKLQNVGDAKRATAAIDRLSAGGGTDMYAAFEQVVSDLEKAEASVKHMIVLTDGQTPDRPYADLLQRARAAKITITSVAIGQDAQIPLLTKIAAAGGGKFYAVRSPLAVPRIFMREVRRVSRPLLRDLVPPQTPIVVSDDPMIEGLGDSFPAMRGFVMTTVKDNALVDVVLRSPAPPNAENSTLLATWNYGLGRVVAFTSDAGRRWTNEWTGWSGYDAFFTNMIRSSMRPTDGSHNYTLATTTSDGTTTVVVDALDNENQFINQNTGMLGTVVGPDSQAIPMLVEQIAPGRYVGHFDSHEPGTYVVAVVPADGPTLRTGVSVGYSPEYRDRAANVSLLETIAALQPRGGEPGQLIGGVDPTELDESAEQLATSQSNPFRHDLPKAVAVDSIWPWLLMAAACLYVGDVGVRRVRFDWASTRHSLAAWLGRKLGRQPSAETPATLERLRSRKQHLHDELATRRAKEPEQTPPETTSPLATATTTPPRTSGSDSTTNTSTGTEPHLAGDSPESDAAASYTERLLQAKRKATRRDS